MHDGFRERFRHDRVTEITDPHALGIVPAIGRMLSLGSAPLRLFDMVCHVRVLDTTVGQQTGYRL